MFEDYLEKVKERSKESKVYAPHQLMGLELAEILNDPKHKALYIRLAKLHKSANLLAIAKSVAERKNIKNKGAYFMKLLYAKDSDDK